MTDSDSDVVSRNLQEKLVQLKQMLVTTAANEDLIQIKVLQS